MPMDPHIMYNRHAATVGIARWFDYEHLPEGDAQAIARIIHDTAEAMIDRLDDGPELTAGLRHLLEAKDCLVRQAIVTAEQRPQPLDPSQ